MILNIGGAALNQTPLDWHNNLGNIQEAIREAREASVDILCLPELCITGYGCEDLFLSDWIYEKALEVLEEVRKACTNITVALGVPFHWQGIKYNTACLIKNQEILGFSVKQFLPNEGVHYEQRWFIPWQAGEITTVEIRGKIYPFGDLIYPIHNIKVAFEICEDAWSGKLRPGYRHAERCVDLILNPSASHFAFGKTLVREGLVIAPSGLFNCAYIFTNLLGNEAGRMVYDGEILIAQKGKLVAKNTRLSYKNVDLLVAPINFDHPEASPVQPVLDSHQKEVEFTKAATLCLFDYLRKSKLKGFVLSLSGGADSSTCAVLVAEMVKRGMHELGMLPFLRKLGTASILQKIPETATDEEKRKIITGELLSTAYQATKNSSDHTFQAARVLAESIGATFYHWQIDDEVGSYTRKFEKAIGRPLTWEQDDITLQNIQARARSPIIWMLANEKNALLITTSNRSEGDVGYATMDGDTSGSIAPIAAVDKYFIQHWLFWAASHLHYPGLEPVNALNPTAELRPADKNQTDESDLMPYAIMVRIERLAIRDRFSPVQVFEVLKYEKLESNELLIHHISKFYRLWARNQWKRERIAPAFHLDDFNVDPRTWCRFPILSSGFAAELEELNRIKT